MRHDSWVTKQDLERAYKKALDEREYSDEKHRDILIRRLNERKTNEMSPELRGRWARLRQLWEGRFKESLGAKYIAGPPLPFEVTMEDPGTAGPEDLGAYRSWFDDKRYYAAAHGNRTRGLFMLAGIIGVFATVFLFAGVGSLLSRSEGVSYIAWSGFVLLGSWSFYLFYMHKRVDRVAHHIFERNTGSVYIFRWDQPHAVYRFHDLYACLSLTAGGYTTNTELMFFYVDPETGDHGFPLMQFQLPTTCEAVEFWLALVRWMDPEWELPDDWYYEFFDILERDERSWYRFRVEGVRFEDGTAEWLLPEEKTFRIGPWHENLPKTKLARNKVFAEMKPLEQTA